MGNMQIMIGDKEKKSGSEEGYTTWQINELDQRGESR
jgi:hypothetical protein